MLASVATLITLAGVAIADDYLFTGTNFEATVYYDLDEANGVDICATSNGGPFPANWAIDSGINGGVTYCQGSSSTAWTLDSLNTNRIVAMNYTMVSGNKEQWCGKEVQIFDANGNEITIDEGPFVLFDGCAAAMSSNIIDMSAKAFAAVKGGTCSGNNPTGLTVKILNNNVSPSGSASSGSAPATATSAAAAQSSTSAAAQSSTSAAAASASASASIRGTGAWWSKSSSAASATATAGNADLAAVHDDASSSTESASTETAAAPAETPSAATPAVASAVVSVVASAASAASSADSSSQQLPASSAAVPVTTDGACTFGAWQCNGLELQVCAYQTTTKLDWETVANCDNQCNFTATGSVNCQ